MELESDRKTVLGRKTKIATGVVAALAIVLLLVEWTVLRGDRVAQMTVMLGPNEGGTFQVHRAGETHVLEIRTERRRNGEQEGRRLEMKVEGPDGTIVYESTELTERKKRKGGCS